MANIFISYRRSDSAAQAGRICDRLRQRFGDDAVFMDVETIEPGANFRTVIEQTIRSCKVFIALIGPTWVTATEKDGTRRIDNAADLVRREVALALSLHSCRVIPVLVGNASAPKRDDLPEPLQSLSDRNAIDIREHKFRADINELLDTLDKSLGRKRWYPASSRASLIGLAALAVAGVAAYKWWQSSVPAASTTTAPAVIELATQSPEEQSSTQVRTAARPSDDGQPDGKWFGALPARMVGISASRFNQFAMEVDKGGKTHGTFSYYFTEALTQRGGDIDKDGKISWCEAVRAATPKIETESAQAQSPVCEGEKSDFAVFSAAPVSPAEKPARKIYAALVGIGKYRIDAGLQGPTNDVDRFAELLGRGERVLAQNVEVLRLKDIAATQAEIWDKLEWLINAPDPEDVAIFYYSGHMTTEFAEGEGSKAPYKAIYPYDTHNIGKINIKMPEIIRALQSSKAKHIVLIIDA